MLFVRRNPDPSAPKQPKPQSTVLCAVGQERQAARAAVGSRASVKLARPAGICLPCSIFQRQRSVAGVKPLPAEFR